MAPVSPKFTVLIIGICSALASSCSSAAAPYTLSKDFNASSPAFFDNFRFFTDADPTYGAAQYVDKPAALQQGLIKSTGGQTYIGVDYTNKYPLDESANRTSVRIESHDLFTRGLFVVDLANMPGGICGTWPAWWFFGDDSPTPGPIAPTGEIDVIENINDANVDTSTLYAYKTAGSCSTSNFDNITYGQREPDPDGNTDIVNCAGDSSGAGSCSSTETRTDSYGPQFNSEGGGVYALQWTATTVKVFFIPRAKIPGGASGPLGANPNPDTWGKPCELYVAQNPAAFKNAYWLINSVKYYQNGQ